MRNYLVPLLCRSGGFGVRPSSIPKLRDHTGPQGRAGPRYHGAWIPPPSVMQPALPPGIQLTDTLEQMQQGMLMRKVKSKSWKKQRYFKLQDDCMTIWYQSKRTGKIESACEYWLLCVVRGAIDRFQSEQGCECMEIL